MSNYVIKDRTKRLAKKLNVIITVSKKKAKKIDVYGKDGAFICSIGSSSNGDYPTYLLQDKTIAEIKRKAYIVRHAKDLSVKGSPGYYAYQLLWS